MKELKRSESSDLAVAICKLLDAKKAENIELYDVAHLSSLADYFVVASASNTTLIKSLADYIDENLSKVGIKELRRDGVGEWIVIDYNEVIVHILTPEVRNFYHMDKLWNDGKNVYNFADIIKMLEKEDKAEKAEKENKTDSKKSGKKTSKKVKES